MDWITKYGIFEYNIIPKKEALWAAAVAAAAFGYQFLRDTDPETVTDWQTWGLALAAGLARVAIAAVFGRAA